MIYHDHVILTSEQGGLTPVALVDAADSAELNQIVRGIKKEPFLTNKSDDRRRGTRAGSGDDSIDERNGRNDVWAISSQSIVRELYRMHESRETAREDKELSQSLFKALGPAEKELFTSLCTTD